MEPDPHFALTVDAVIFSKSDAGLNVLLIRRAYEPFKDRWAFAGGYVNIDEVIDDAVCRELEEETNLSNISLKRVDVFDAVDRDPRESIELPLLKIQIPEMSTMEVYDHTMTAVLMDLKGKGVTASVFGDIFLEDLRKYREEKLAELNLTGVFPLWKMSTSKLIREFIGSGFKAITPCINDKYLDKSFVGRIIDDDFLNDLPDGVDPCGENGEYHSFVFDAPFFSNPIEFEIGAIVYRKYTASEQEDQSTAESDTTKSADSPFDNGFWYCDLLPFNR